MVHRQLNGLGGRGWGYVVGAYSSVSRNPKFLRKVFEGPNPFSCVHPRLNFWIFKVGGSNSQAVYIRVHPWSLIPPFLSFSCLSQKSTL